MQVINSYITKNRPYSALKPVGIVLHETATPGATAMNERNYFNNNDVKASANAFIDWYQVVVTIPFNEKSWHAAEPANSMFLGIELCRPASHDPAKFQIVYNGAVEFFSNTFINNLKVTRVTKDNLMSHHEVSLRWHNTNHTDPDAYFKEYGKTVDGFRADVQKAINAKINPVQPEPPKEENKVDNTPDAYAQAAVKKALDRGILKGDNGDYKLHSPLTRQDFFVFLERLGLLK